MLLTPTMPEMIVPKPIAQKELHGAHVGFYGVPDVYGTFVGGVKTVIFAKIVADLLHHLKAFFDGGIGGERQVVELYAVVEHALAGSHGDVGAAHIAFGIVKDAHNEKRHSVYFQVFTNCKRIFKNLLGQQFANGGHFAVFCFVEVVQETAFGEA